MSQQSKTRFCAHCGTPAVKWVPPKPGNPAWRPRWINGCAHVGQPVRMSAARAEAVTARFIAAREHRLARVREPIAGCDGEPVAS